MDNKITDAVASAIEDYPPAALKTFMSVRELVAKVAEQTAGLDQTEETLKWGEPSYLAEGGSTVRMKWTEKNPEEFYLYFNCQSTLVETFRELYRDEFDYDGNRAMSFAIDAPLPEAPLEHCLSMAMQYHSLKKLPLLGN